MRLRLGHSAEAARTAWRNIGSAVALFVVSPIPVVLLIAAADQGVLSVSVEAAIAIGLGSFFLIAAVGALQLVRATNGLSPFVPIRRKRLQSDFAALQWAKDLDATHQRQRTTSLAVAVALWVLSPLPLMVAALLEPTPSQGLWIAGGTAFLLLVVAAGLFMVLLTAWSRYVAAKLASAER
ncbi:hypothetical protein [Microbacterium hatanonis]|uniref:hypothetical protein n=1 Tax=Microbacterium hatanonis TaxID=404366 RepID=UPI001FE89FCC|nr:hypothetical protein [Microbacterium hatanonis]